MKKIIVSIIVAILILNMIIIPSGNTVYAGQLDVIWLNKGYDYVRDFKEGLAQVELNGKYGYIDKAGKEIIPLKYDHVGDFSEGLAVAVLNRKRGYIDKTGKEIIPLKYDDAFYFSEGLAGVELNGKWGHIDKTGKEITPLKYDFTWDFNEGLAGVGLNGKWGYIDKAGKEITLLKYDRVFGFSEGLAEVELNRKWGHIDKTGKEITPLKYDSIGGFSEGLARTGLNGKIGYIDKTGKEIIPLKYDGAWDFREGLAYVKLNGKWGYIDKTGKEITPLKYDNAWDFSEGLVGVELNGKWGYIDKTGKEIIPLKYDNAWDFREGLAAVELNGKWGYIDKTGKEIISLKYDSVRSFSEGLAEVKLNGKYGYIDKTGKEVTPLKYDDVGSFREGLATVKLNGKWGIIKNPLTSNTTKKSESSMISLKLNTNALTLEEGQTTKLSANVEPSDAVLSYSTSDPWIATVSNDGIITARRAGTVVISVKAWKNGYKEEVRSLNLTVTGLKEFNLTLEPQLLILRQGDTRKITSNLASDVKLTSTISNLSIIDIIMQGTGGKLTAKNIGESNIRFTAQKQGYRTDYVDGKVIVLDNNYKSKDVIKQSTSHWYNILPEDKTTRPVREKIVQDAETIITSLTKKNISGSNGTIILNRSTIEGMAKEAKNIRTEINKYIEEVDINPSRTINLRFMVEADVNPIKNTISVRLNKNDLTNLKDIDYIYTYIKEYGITIGLDARTINRQYLDNNSIIIEIQKDNDAYIIKFIDENGKEIKTLNQNIILILPIESINPYETSVFKQDDKTITQIGGSYDADSEGISIETKTGGRYYVGENKTTFSDIANIDEEMRKAIEFLSSKGIITGMSDGKFNPDGTLTRSQFTTMLVKSFYALDTNLKTDFKDVKPTEWFHDYVASSQKENIVKGFDDKTFRPNNNITKEQMIALVSRALVNKKQYIYPDKPEDYLIYLTDNGEIGEWAKKEVALAIKERTMEIPKDFIFNPQGVVTRGEAARTLYRMFLKLY